MNNTDIKTNDIGYLDWGLRYYDIYVHILAMTHLGINFYSDHNCIVVKYFIRRCSKNIINIGFVYIACLNHWIEYVANCQIVQPPMNGIS